MAPLKLVLPSDSSLDLYPDNKIWHYRVRLSEPVIPGAEITLSDITYPTSTTSSGFYVTLPGLVNNVWSSAKPTVNIPQTATPSVRKKRKYRKVDGRRSRIGRRTRYRRHIFM